jgi:hypothetical protein
MFLDLFLSWPHPSVLWKGKTLSSIKKPEEAVLAWQNGCNSLFDPERQNSFKNMCKMLLK